MEAASYAASIPADQKSYASTYSVGGTEPTSKLVPAQTQTVAQSGFNPANYGEAGIGMKDLTALRNQGFNKDQIAAYVGSQREKGTPIGGTGRRFIRPDASTTTKRALKIADLIQSNMVKTGFGFEDVKELAPTRLRKDQISQYVDYLQGRTIQRSGADQEVAEMDSTLCLRRNGTWQKDLIKS